MNPVSHLRGILPVLPTPYTEDGGVDLCAFRRVTRFALSAGAAGIVYPGFASEAETLDANERAACLRAAVEEITGRVPLVAGASAQTEADVLDHCRIADALKIGWVMIQPPKRMGSDAALVARLLRSVSAAFPDLRIVVQNAPAPRGSDLDPDTLLSVASAVDAVDYVKEESIPAGPAISRLVRDAVRPGRLRGMIGGGGARFVLDEYRRGACAAMPAAELVDLHVALDRAWRDGRPEEARDLYVRTLPLLVLQTAYRMRLTKHVLTRRGILRNSRVRVSLPELDCPAVRDIDAEIERLGLNDAPETAAGRAA